MSDIGNGMVVIGRDDRMGLGSMTEDFCRAMRPDRVVLVDVGGGRAKLNGASQWGKSTVRTHRALLSHEPNPVQLLRGKRVVVGFETFYANEVTAVARKLGVKSVIFPMWEWSSAEMVASCDHAICLSETDFRHYWDLMRVGGAVYHRYDWPKMPAHHEMEGARKSYHPAKDAPPRQWPPQTFVHFAGNARHNRDGTREVLQASKHLEGTEAKLVVHANFSLREVIPEQGLPYGVWTGLTVTKNAPVASRHELLAGADCCVFPRRLGGHSLPINEATGENIPTIVLDLPDWRRWPYRVRPVAQPREKFGPQLCDVARADPKELGQLMQAMALGHIPLQPCPKLPSWSEFTDWWQQVIDKAP